MITAYFSSNLCDFKCTSYFDLDQSLYDPMNISVTGYMIFISVGILEYKKKQGNLYSSNPVQDKSNIPSIEPS